jgi:cytochrome P450/NADPH-cytochrome P450 reductase
VRSRSGCSLQFKYTLTIKPEVHVRAVPRAGKHVLISAPSSGLRDAREGLSADTSAAPAESAEGKLPMYVLYGSNTGSCESFAQKIATAAPAYGANLP